MRVSLRWLKELVDFDLAPGELAEMLTFSGTKVESLHRLDSDIAGVVVAEVEEIAPHPDADNLWLVTAGTPQGDRRVVCGASNYRVGDHVPLANVGARVGDLQVSPRKIRGVVSEGMLCSGFELGVTRDHSGILILPPGTPTGADIVEVLALDDTVLELELTLNRPDCTGMIGIAREVAALVRAEVRLPDASVPEDAALPSPVSVQIDDVDRCPRYLARYLTDVAVGPAPFEIAGRLLVSGVRPISNVVDATNYVLLETGHPLHAFDAAMVDEQKIIVRRAGAGEVIRTLDGVERKLHPEDLLITDPGGAIGIAGVMGGEESEVTDSTTSLVLEAAYFDPSSIAFTSRRHGLRTEASSRFEKGADPEMAPFAAARAARLIAETAGAAVSATTVDHYPEPIQRARVTLRPTRTDELLGTHIDAEVQVDHLESLGLGIVARQPHIEVEVPTFRPDLTREVDLIEEVARLAGLELLPSTLPAGPAGGLDRMQIMDRRCRRALVGMGLFEVWTDSFGSASELDDLGLGQDHPARDMVEIANPSSDLDGSLRTTLIPRLVRAAAHNFARRAPGVGLFEIARIYLARSHPLPDEALMIGFVFAGERVPTSWTAGQQGWDFFAAKGVLEALTRSLGAPVLRARPITKMPFHPTRAAGLTIGDLDVGVLGELHPRVCESYSVPEGTVVAEISATRLFEVAAEVAQAVEPSRYPAVYLDLAFVVPDDVAAELLWDAIAIAGAPELSSMRLFDLYEGPQVGEGNKSLAFALELRAPDRTLTDEEAEAVRHRIVTAAADRVGAVLRT